MPKKEFNVSLEGLRGFAAAVVMIGHVFYHDKNFDPSYCPTILKSLFLGGRIMVLIFFVLSGFVIGISHPEQMRRTEIKTYLKKRILRIYPIYFIAMCLALVVAGFHYDKGTVVANFTMTQNIWKAPFWEDNPAWSINYEFLYYLLFIPISFFRIKPSVAFVISLGIGFLNLYLPASPVITAYFIGFCFWLSGLLIARNFKGNLQVKFLPFMFYILAVQNILRGVSFMPLVSRIKAPLVKDGLWSQLIISIDDVILIPYCFMAVLIFSGRTFKGKNIVFIFLTLIMAYYLERSLSYRADSPIVIFGTAYFALFLITLVFPVFNEKIKNGLAFTGGISYAIYIIHFPVICILGHVVFHAAPVVGYWVKVVLLVGIVGLLSWLLEKKLQPWLRGFFMPPKPLAESYKAS